MSSSVHCRTCEGHGWEMNGAVMSPPTVFPIAVLTCLYMQTLGRFYILREKRLLSIARLDLLAGSVPDAAASCWFAVECAHAARAYPDGLLTRLRCESREKEDDPHVKLEKVDGRCSYDNAWQGYRMKLKFVYQNANMS